MSNWITIIGSSNPWSKAQSMAINATYVSKHIRQYLPQNGLQNVVKQRKDFTKPSPRSFRGILTYVAAASNIKNTS